VNYRGACFYAGKSQSAHVVCGSQRLREKCVRCDGASIAVIISNQSAETRAFVSPVVVIAGISSGTGFFWMQYFKTHLASAVAAVSRKQNRNIELLDHACGGCGVSQEIPPLESLLGSPIVPKKIEAEARASLKTCRALINRIEAGLSAEELIVNVSSAGELLFYLEFAASVLEKSAPRPRKRGQTAAEDRPGGVIA
jgi:hypothetical protein